MKLQPSDKKAFLPTPHLSDELALCPLLFDAFKIGDVIERVVFYGRKNVLVRFVASTLSVLAYSVQFF